MKKGKLTLGIINGGSLFLGILSLILSFTPLRMIVLYPAIAALIMAVSGIYFVKFKSKTSRYAVGVSALAIIIILIFSFVKKTEIDKKDDLTQQVIEQDTVSIDEEFEDIMDDTTISVSDIFDEPEETDSLEEVFEEDTEIFEEESSDTPFGNEENYFNEE